MERDLRVGSWMVQPRRLQIARGDEVRRLGPKGMGVLLRLAERPGAVVAKEELVQGVWDGAFTSDEALSAVIYELRKVLDDDAREPRFIETIRGSGYRLVAAVAEEPPAPRSRAAADGIPQPQPASSSTRSRRWLAATLAAALLLTTAWLWGRNAQPVAPQTPQIRSLAVLPIATFANTSSPDLLAGALTDMLTADLAQLCPVEVTPGISVRGHTERWQLDQVEDLLGVDAVVEGSVLRSSDRVWISVQLTDTRSGRLLWSASYDRELGDELLMLREVALDIAQKVQGQVSPPAAAGP